MSNYDYNSYQRGPTNPRLAPQYNQLPFYPSDDGTNTRLAPVFTSRGDPLQSQANSPLAAIVVDDYLLKTLNTQITTMVAANTILKYIVGILGSIIYLITLMLVVLALGPGISKVPQFISGNIVWRAVLSKIPLAIWFILAILATALIGVLEPLKGLQNYALIVISVLMIYYAFMSKRANNCKRYLLAIAGGYVLLYAAYRQNLLGISTTVDSAVITTLMTWSVTVAIVLIVIDHYIYLPRCGRAGSEEDDF